MKEQFMQDLQVIYDELQVGQAGLNKYYDLLDENKGHERANLMVDAFLKLCRFKVIIAIKTNSLYEIEIPDSAEMIKPCYVEII